jgi:hypothetical protein
MNLSWLLGGRMQIGIAGSGAVCTAVINDAEVVLITNNIEARRLQEEEVGDVPRILALPWADGEPAVQAQAELAGNAPLLEADCAEELQQLRSCRRRRSRKRRRSQRCAAARWSGRSCSSIPA